MTISPPGIPLRSPCMYLVPRDDGKPGTILGCRTQSLVLFDVRNGLVQCRACGHWSAPPADRKAAP